MRRWFLQRAQGPLGAPALTCSTSVATRHVEAILRMRGVAVRVPRDLDPSARLVGLSEVEAALKGALVLWEMREEVEKQREERQARLDRLPPECAAVVPYISPSS